MQQLYSLKVASSSSPLFGHMSSVLLASVSTQVGQGKIPYKFDIGALNLNTTRLVHAHCLLMSHFQYSSERK